MKTTFLVFLVMLTVLAAIGASSVLAYGSLDVGSPVIEVDGQVISGVDDYVAVEAGDIIPVDIYFTFTAGEDAEDEDAEEVEISAWIEGHRSDRSERDFADLLEGREYHAKLSLTIPKDLDETEDDLTLYVRIETDAGTWEEDYTLSIQRKPHKTDVLFVEVDRVLDAGSNAAVDVVVKNLGRHELDDLIVSVSILELGLERRAYFGDLDATDECPEDEEDCDDEDYEDTTERRIYLKIPVNVKAGVYELVVEAYNDDVSEVVKKKVEIIGAEEATRVVVPMTSREIAAGEIAIYDLIIVNSGSKIGVYEIIAETAEGVVVNVAEPIVTVPAGSSRTVTIEVKAGDRTGMYNFAVNVNSQDKLVQRAVLNAKIIKGAVVKSNLTLLTIVLAIVFVVLLIVLIVLLTRKPERPEELEESYY